MTAYTFPTTGTTQAGDEFLYVDTESAGRQTPPAWLPAKPGRPIDPLMVGIVRRPLPIDQSAGRMNRHKEVKIDIDRIRGFSQGPPGGYGPSVKFPMIDTLS